ncbi:ribosome recycling factor [Ruminococcaceae bacterium OttesenSCG-928-O06]|nr:ribosome recycling factor [Ruminococcaceae bacterium OttesenSCG-928-O06]
MPSDSLKPYAERMDKALNHLSKELGAIRAGRANPAVLDKIQVDYYGTPTPINQVAAVAVAESRILTISPWDSTLMKEIEKAILTSDIGINPTNDGKIMRLVFPSPTEERRKQLSREVLKLGEDAKVAVRNIRRDAIEDFKQQKKKSEITEDDLKNLENEVQKLTDKNTKEIDRMCEAKTGEIMEI